MPSVGSNSMEAKGASRRSALSIRPRASALPCPSRLITSLLGPYLLWTARREERRLAAGATYEPPTIIERRNWTLPEGLDNAVPALPEFATQGD